ncbi:phospholipase D-like domain-containing protein [Pseudoalteromonas shioyasakiensis]|uniref:phospholipase D-like domain-containing protein n=1 Tax=Pseudoalteromonas shioyasakiensis TaxID=1190813 RepID=UPI0021191257|nr:phospholipase D-like domain-containing protein [Pseudoalteromonas shioyasakiensis]MCQ8878844.1 phospholipase D-like domain-containing protein [Pseudoalteromonas shioyasakiensis]
MSSLISNTELTIQLEELLPSCKNLTIISAFMTQPATRWLGQLTSNNKPKVHLVGRFTPIDFAKGASDLNALRDCINNGYQVKALVNLHAKIYQIDHDTIFNGSANLTGKGLALVNNGNLESCSRVNACEQSKAFINKIVESATDLSLNMLDKMQSFLEQLDNAPETELPAVWPEEILPQTTELFVSDFPLSKPGEYCEIYSINPSLEFAVIEKNKLNFDDAQTLFKNSKAYCWLKATLIANEGNRDLGFGQISSLLHDALCDDPAPYRRDIKDIQANLYEAIKIYAKDEMEIYVPGRRSEVIKLIKGMI